MVLRIRVVPRSGKTLFDSLMDDGTYKIRLKAPPVDGKANKELLRWLSREFSADRESVVLLSGASSRTKLVEISGEVSRPDWFHG